MYFLSQNLNIISCVYLLYCHNIFKMYVILKSHHLNQLIPLEDNFLVIYLISKKPGKYI